MKKGYNQIKERERSRAQKSIYSGELQTTIGNIFFCASKIALTHSAKIRDKKKSNVTQILSDLHVKGQLKRV